MEGRFVDQLANRVKMVENNLWTTPCSRDWKGKTITKNHPEGFNKSLANDVIKSPTTPDHPVSGQLNPTWVEWLMGWPLGWTDLKPLATAKFLSWQQQHGVSSSEEEKPGSPGLDCKAPSRGRQAQRQTQEGEAK
jgi:hypothetical protein